jgi:hypothetical protein
MGNVKLKSLLKENVADIKQYRNKPSDAWNETLIKLTLMRKIEGKTAVYRLETDNWFRRFEGPAKGYGIMIRDIKIAKNPAKVPYSWAHGPNQVALKTIIKYLPNSFDHSDDDIPENYEKAEGFVFLGNQYLKGYNMLEELSPKDLEHFIKMNIPNYKP